jgi:hypothetical protein
MSEPVNLDALREAVRDAKNIDWQEQAVKGAERVKLEKAKSGERLRTNGFGTLSLDDQERFMQGLRAKDIEFGLVGKGADREVVLPQSSLEGKLGEVVMSLLASFGLAVS